ncbi:hypothetical protein P4U24_17085 [Aeribacillus composti]|uniref:GltB/FmdC/FwdC-like GXGXG domain-containing protein n=1 Tax=Aeribacillus composti TaxID=1868734 RepID=UPI002E226572|nr:hypothetical protein [Aeribacillus composti]
MESVKESIVIDCKSETVTSINQMIREFAKNNIKEVIIENPLARHNLGVCITDPIHLIYNGDVGYYAVSLCDKVTATIKGNCGWAVGENLMSGEIVVNGNAASSCAASLRGGIVVVKGEAGARAGISMKGGTLIIGGNTGYMTGFMMQKGKMIICGDAGKALGDSMYDGVIYVGGKIAELGNGTKVEEVSEEEKDEIKSLLDFYQIELPPSFQKIVPNGLLHHFNKKEFRVWKEIL